MTNEVLDGIRYNGWELVLDVSGGGVAERIPKGVNYKVVAARLRFLADRLERNVELRAARQE